MRVADIHHLTSSIFLLSAARTDLVGTRAYCFCNAANAANTSSLCGVTFTFMKT